MCELFSRVEAARYLRMSTRTLFRRTREGKIRYVSDHRGARVFYRQCDLDKYLKEITHVG